MKKIFKQLNYLVLITLTSLIAFGGLLSLAPVLVSAAPPPPDPAGGAGTFYSLSVQEQAVVWTSLQAATSLCRFYAEGVSKSDIGSGKWFYNTLIRIGAHVEPDDGKLECSNEAHWFSNLLDKAGYADDYLAPADSVFEVKNDGLYYPKTQNPDTLRSVLAANLFNGNLPSSTPEYVTYSILFTNFTDQNHECKAAPITSANQGSKFDKTLEIMVYDEATNKPKQQPYGWHSDGGKAKASVGPGTGVQGVVERELSCDKIANYLKDAKFANAVASCISAGQCSSYTSTDGSGGTASGDDPQLRCGLPNPLNWFICPIVKGINLLVSGLDNAINTLLTVNQDEIFGTNGKESATSPLYYSAWKSFRNISLGLLLIAAITMVLAQSLGFEFLDAYTIKKIFPRLIVAIIGIALSWQIMSFLVGFTNDLGFGIRQIIYLPFKKLNSDLSIGGGDVAALSLLTGVGVMGMQLVGLLSFGLTALLAVAIAFLVLIIRQLVIIVLILMAPLAIACYILPNTNGVWKLWSESLMKGLLMFPIIVSFLAVGRVFAMVSTTKDAGAGGVTALSQLIGFAAYFLPYFMIPLTFRFAGGALRTIGGFTNDKGRGGFDRLKKFRAGKSAEAMAKNRNFSRVSDKTKLGRGINNTIGAAFNPTSVLHGRSGVRARRTARQAMQGAGFEKENEIYGANGNDDNFLLALASKDLANEKLDDAKYRASTLTGQGQTDAQAEVYARQKGLDAASQIPVNTRNSRAVRMSALRKLAQTGYQFKLGAQGYKELSKAVGGITGNDQGARAATMDELQYHLKNAGRFDLGGINHGAVYDYEKGVDKSSGYTSGNAKIETFTAGMEHYLQSSGFSVDPTTGAKKKQDSSELAADLMSKYQAGNVNASDISTWHAKLLDAEPGAIGGNKKEIIRQREAIEQVFSQVNSSPRPYQSPSDYELVDGISNNIRRSRMSMDPNLIEEGKK